MPDTLIIGVDTGGTFTDFVYITGDDMVVRKIPSTPENPAQAVLEGLQGIAADGRQLLVVHGSTVATNSLLERKGASTLLITTAGFEDVIEIARQNRQDIYDLNVDGVEPLIPRERRLGVVERIGPRGEIVTALTDDELARTVAAVKSMNPEAVAVCFLHSYANPDHEKAVTAALREVSQAFIKSSHEVLPEFREYERTTTTVINAYLGPIMDRYLAHLEEHFTDGPIRIMQSNGGAVSIGAAKERPVVTALSGPAGGVVGGFELGRLAGYDQLITFDMGGTSTDVSLCPGELLYTSEATVGPLPIRIPMIDIHTVGAGGGSMAYLDDGGALRVGPESAGARPGPICYALGGTRLTVTDANLYLGRLSEEHFLGGEQSLDSAAVASAMASMAGDMGIAPTRLAQGILEVATAVMERAIRVISIERGYDPREFSLVSFGGAGGMHALDLARALQIPRVIVPQAAGVASAIGMLLADVVRDYSQTLLWPAEEAISSRLEAEVGTLTQLARADFAAEGISAGDITYAPMVEVRYVGQGYEIRVNLTHDLVADFHRAHHQRYGYSDPGRPVELVNLRLRATSAAPKPSFRPRPLGGTDHSAAVDGKVEIVFGEQQVQAELIRRERLRPGNRFQGPALIVEYSTTTVVPVDGWCAVDHYGNLLLTFEEPAAP